MFLMLHLVCCKLDHMTLFFLEQRKVLCTLGGVNSYTVIYARWRCCSVDNGGIKNGVQPLNVSKLWIFIETHKT